MIDLNNNLLIAVNQCASASWNGFRAAFGPKIGKCPVVFLNGRFRRKLGCAYLLEDRIELATTLIETYPVAFAKAIIPHELAHFVAWRLHECHTHHAPWKRIMERMGLEPSPFIDPRDYK